MLSGTFDAPKEASGLFGVQPGESVSYTLTSESVTGSVVFERARKGLAAFEPIITYADEDAEDVSATYKNESNELELVRLRCVAIDDDPGSESVDYTLGAVDGDVLDKVYDRYGRVVYTVDDQRKVAFAGDVSVQGLSVSLNSYEELTTNDTTATAVSLGVYQSRLTTSGSEGAEDAEIGDGTGAVVGQRKLITLAVRTHASDSVDLDDTNMSQGADTITAVALDAANEFILLEWQGAKWEIIAATSGVVTTE